MSPTTTAVYTAVADDTPDSDGERAMSDMLADIRAALQQIEAARRIVLCSPDLEPRIKGVVDSYGWGGLVTVETSPYVPDDKVYIFADDTLTATVNAL